MRWLIITCFFTSCFSFIDERIYSIDPKLEPYYKMFLEEGKKRGYGYNRHDIIMYFSELKGHKAGISVNRIDYVIEIAIDRTNWNNSNENIREVLIMHELGHGILQRSHNNNCNSVMIQANDCKFYNYLKRRKEMLDELFSTSY